MWVFFLSDKRLIYNLFNFFKATAHTNRLDRHILSRPCTLKLHLTSLVSGHHPHLILYTFLPCSSPNYTVSQKKVPAFKLSVTLSNHNRFSKFLHCWKVYEICYKTHDNTHLILAMLLHYRGKLKIQIFCRCGRNYKQTALVLFKIASLSPYWLQIKFSMSLFSYLFTFAINLCGVNKLLKKFWDTGTVDRRPGSGRPHSEKKIAMPSYV